MQHLLDTTTWRDDTITLFGRTHPVPRRTSYVGDPGQTYSYSRLEMTPHPWTPALSDIRRRIEALSGASFNAVLLNLYRDGRDSNGWHADDEAELGRRPVIASLSLGAPRDMQFKRRDNSARWRVTLTNGSLLVMSGDAQSDWLHCIPKQRRVTEARINLTFRMVQLASAR